MSYLQFSSFCTLSTFVISLIVMFTISVSLSLAIASPTESTERSVFETFIVLYTNAINEHNSINCSFPFQSGETLQLWTAPPGVQIIALSDNDTVNPNDDDQRSSKIWVELTLDNSLVFHNPDESLTGPYTCLTLVNNKNVFQKTVWVVVLRKSFFDVHRRLKTACLTSGVFLVMLVSSCACYFCRPKKANYSLARGQDDVFEIHQTMDETGS